MDEDKKPSHATVPLSREYSASVPAHLIKRQGPKASLISHGVEYLIHHREWAGEPEGPGRLSSGTGRLLIFVNGEEHAYALTHLHAPASLSPLIELFQQIQLVGQVALLEEAAEVHLDVADARLQTGELGQ